MTMQGTASNNAPSSYVVTPHFLIGAMVWLLSTLLLLFNVDILLEHFFNPRLLAITHLLVLSWITTLIFGAMYQLLPVILLCKLYSERIALMSFITLQLGSLGMFLCFWNQLMDYRLILSGVLVSFSILLFGINLFLTILRSTVQRIEKTFIITAAVWLGITVTLGLLLAINFSFPFLNFDHLELLKSHAHFGLIGWFTQLIIGVSSVLIPMFLLAHNLNKRALTLSYFLINSALIVGAFSQILNFEIGVNISLVLGITGLISYLYFIYSAYSARIRKNLDLGMKKSITAFYFTLLGICFSLPVFFNFFNINLHLETAYFSILILGFVSTLILGQTFKTLPFIIWLKEYKSFVGKEKTPLPKDLYSDKLLKWQYRMHTIGVLIVLAGISFRFSPLLQIGCGLIVIGAILYLKNVLSIAFHKRTQHGTISN